MRLVHTVNFLLNIVAEVVAYKYKSGQEETLVTSADEFYTAGIWQNRSYLYWNRNFLFK